MSQTFVASCECNNLKHMEIRACKTYNKRTNYVKSAANAVIFRNKDHISGSILLSEAQFYLSFICVVWVFIRHFFGRESGFSFENDSGNTDAGNLATRRTRSLCNQSNRKKSIGRPTHRNNQCG